MKRIFLLLACIGMSLLVACGGDSRFPEASGKASIRAINAIPRSSVINFRVEQRSIDTIVYKTASTSVRYDDLDYTFYFDAQYSGEQTARRIGSRQLDVVADKDYTFLVSGPLANPTITLWEGDERIFEAEETVFEARFAHTAASLGSVDVYFALPGVAPVLGEQVATLAFGEISPAVDYAADDYVLTITAAGDPAIIEYVSDTVTFAERGNYIITPFDGDTGDNGPVFARALNSTGNSLSMPDPRFPPTVEFINASMDLGTSDIYDDEMLTSLRLQNHAFRDVSAEIDVAVGANTFYYTPAGSTASVTLEGQMSAISGLRYRVFASGAAGALLWNFLIPDRQPIDTSAKFLIHPVSVNFAAVDLYIVDADATIDELAPSRPGLVSGLAVSPTLLAPGSYDVYLTAFDTKDIAAGPYRIDVARGDIVDTIVFDTVDPAVLDIVFLSGGPAP